MYSVELLPDAATDTGVRRLWQSLTDAGVPSLARHRHPTNRPHVTLAVVDDVTPARAALTTLLSQALPVDVDAAEPAVFRGSRRSTLVLELPVTPALADLHARVWSLLTDAGAAPLPQLGPGSWRPHLTLALRLPPVQADIGLALVTPPDVGRGQLIAGRSWDIVGRAAGALFP